MDGVPFSGWQHNPQCFYRSIDPKGITCLTADKKRHCCCWSSVQRFEQGSRWPTNCPFHIQILEFCRQQRQHHSRAHLLDKDDNTYHTFYPVRMLLLLLNPLSRSREPLHLEHPSNSNPGEKTSVREPRQTREAFRGVFVRLVSVVLLLI
jgi:hypothetical protein